MYASNTFIIYENPIIIFDFFFDRLGCVKIVVGSDRLSHEVACSYRNTLCPVSKKCSEIVTFNRLKHHIEFVHNMKAFDSDYVNLTMNNFGFLLTKMRNADYTFNTCLIKYNTVFFFRIVLRDYKLNLYTIQKYLTFEPNVSREMSRYQAKIGLYNTHQKCKINMPIGNKDYTKTTILLAPDLWVKMPAGNKFHIHIKVIPCPANVNN